MKTLRTVPLALSALLLSGLAVAPSAQAGSVELADPGIQSPLCPEPHPEAWVNYCFRLVSWPIAFWAYSVDTTPDHTTVCPTPTICVSVPVILSLVDPALYVVPYYVLEWYVAPDVRQVHEDVCDVIGVACRAIDDLVATGPSGQSSEMPHGLELQGLGDTDANGAPDAAFFLAPGGESVVLPLV
jgi:hypothetical protein